MKRMIAAENVDAYLVAQPENVRPLLAEIRNTIKALFPEALAVISYAMPAFRLNKVFEYYAGFKNHYSLFVPGAR